MLVQIRDVDETVRDQLKARAAAEGVSLNAYLSALLTEAAGRPTREEVFQRIRLRSERSDVGSASIVRQQRDERAGRASAS